MDEEQALIRKRKEHVLRSELKKFEKGLCISRPRFRDPSPAYTWSKQNISLLDNFDVYEEGVCKSVAQINKVNIKKIKKIDESQQTDKCKNPGDESYNASIKITIKDKPTTGDMEKNLEILRNAFEIIVVHGQQERRLRYLRIKIEKNAASRRLRRYFVTWKSRLENSKILDLKRKKESEISDERKIELFVNAINEKQNRLTKKSLFRIREPHEEIDKSLDGRWKNHSASRTIHVVDPPAQNRLNAQKKIIDQQKIKLAEQNKLIQDLRLKQIEDEKKTGSDDSMYIAKEALGHCGGKTRRILMQLMRDRGSRSIAQQLEPPSKIRSSPGPRFLVRMEARAEARRQRVKRAEEERIRKIEDEKMIKQVEKQEQEHNRKLLQLQAQREAKRIRQEKENKRLQELERSKAVNEMADKFYRKYLLQHYIMEPFVLLIEQKHNHMKAANDHFVKNLLRKIVMIWKTETNNQREIKIDLSSSVWRRNLLWYSFGNWREAAKAETQKTQVAIDFYEMRLQERCMKILCKRTMEAKIRNMENQQLASCHNEKRCLVMCFNNWRKYVDIADQIKESDQIRDRWRQIIQRVVPDFDPKQRGVIIDN